LAQKQPYPMDLIFPMLQSRNRSVRTLLNCSASKHDRKEALDLTHEELLALAHHTKWHLRFNSLSTAGRRTPVIKPSELRALAEELPAHPYDPEMKSVGDSAEPGQSQRGQATITPKTGKQKKRITASSAHSHSSMVFPSPFHKSLSDLPCDTCPYAACDPNNCAIQSVKESELIMGAL